MSQPQPLIESFRNFFSRTLNDATQVLNQFAAVKKGNASQHAISRVSANATQLLCQLCSEIPAWLDTLDQLELDLLTYSACQESIQPFSAANYHDKAHTAEYLQPDEIASIAVEIAKLLAAKNQQRSNETRRDPYSSSSVDNGNVQSQSTGEETPQTHANEGSRNYD